MKIGIVGLPNVGKSTLFNSITNGGAGAANYPFCTVDPNVGIVAVPDERLQKLAEIYNPEKITPATIEFVDIAGLVRGASKGEGLGNKFLANIREVDAICHVVRCFESGDIVHVDGEINPKRDVKTINLELIFSDLEALEKRIEKTQKLLKSDKKYEIELNFFNKIKNILESGKKISSENFTKDEDKILKTLNLLTSKPVIYIANVSENDFLSGIEKNKFYNEVLEIAKTENAEVVPICADFEAQISEMNEEEKKLFLKEAGLEKSGLERLISASYVLLGLISYLTAGKPEVRAWTIQKGTKAPQAAGKIHTDFERGFIRAEIISFNDLIKFGSATSAKEHGLMRSEGKDYVIQDGDIVLFRFNV